MYYQTGTRKSFKMPSTLVTALAGIGALALVIEFILFFVKAVSNEINTYVVFDIISKVVLVAASVIFIIYYFFFYKANKGVALVLATYIGVAAYGFVLAVRSLFTLIEGVSAEGADVFKVMISNLPPLTVPVIITILFALVSMRFFTNNFSKLIYTMALAFVLAVLPEEVMSAFCNLITSSADDKLPLITAILLPVGKALFYTALVFFGVKEFYGKVSKKK